MSLLKLWFIRNPVMVSYSICVQQGSSNLSGSQSALTCLCVCARAQLGLREFNTNVRAILTDSLDTTLAYIISFGVSGVFPPATNLALRLKSSILTSKIM
jgi:hypothetical protein